MNNTYILLRNNSESTPLSLNDLERIGLLPTDLLWVECQSVCWQHPHEIPSLKHLVSAAVSPQPKPVSEEWQEKYAPPVENETTIHHGKSSVHVTLPSKDNSLKIKTTEKSTAKQEIPAWQKETKTANSVNTAHSSNLSFNDTLLDADTKDSWQQPPAHKDKTALLESLLSLPRKKVAVYAGLVAAGALMMLIIRGTGGNEKMTPPPISQQTEIVNAPPAEEIEEEPTADSTIIPESYTQQNTPLEEPAVVTTKEAVISVPVTKEIPVKKATAKQVLAPTVNEPPARNTAPVAEEKEVKKAPAENIATKLRLKANEYNVAAFGGIRNLKMTLQNDSRYLLDKVSVELRYLNPEGTVVKTETIDFNFVRPGEEATVAVKKTSRGVKVDYKIIRIESKELAAANTAAGESNTYSKN